MVSCIAVSQYIKAERGVILQTFNMIHEARHTGFSILKHLNDLQLHPSRIMQQCFSIIYSLTAFTVHTSQFSVDLNGFMDKIDSSNL